MAEREHSRIGPSSAKRWMNCPGSVTASEGLPSRAGKAAEDGTAVHSLLEATLKEGIVTQPGNTNAPEADAVHVFAEWVRSRQWTIWYAEQRLEMPAFLKPPEPMYGTADFIGYIDNTLHIADLKYGLQVVEPEENEQLLYYAVMAYYFLRGWYIEQVTMTIIQPRVYHPNGPIRSWTIPVKRLFEFAGKLLNKARETQAPDAPLKAGDWCMFCPAAPHCPALRERATAIAQQEFPIVRQDVGDNFGMIDKPPEPQTLPTTILSDIASQLPILEGWVEAVKGEVERRMLAGEQVPGFAFADKKSWRRWKDDAAAKLLEKFNEDEIYERSLKSPAQVEKMIGKKAMTELAEHITKGSGGKKVVRASDPLALPAAQDEFTVEE